MLVEMDGAVLLDVDPGTAVDAEPLAVVAGATVGASWLADVLPVDDVRLLEEVCLLADV